ncbi:OsmC family protein [Oxalobacter formigenes]|uniref:OsmC family protein n=1 Tax=Oxalobacter formigenes TaxID=847 RepID=UPI0022AED739|nr:OsmC family protein [Oxalobacter formigenes]WAW05458.1 OsmC family protein [Oxalobacter formigenes]
MNRTGTARWYGGIKDGKGTLTTESNTLSNTPYSFSARFKDGSGTNPEELIAAAHAGCFTMDLSGRLGAANMVADEIDTTATLTMDKTDKGFTITKIHLDVKAKIPGGDVYEFQTAVGRAKEGCPVSRLLNAEITVDAQLVS